jgi:hypothetical protein
MSFSADPNRAFRIVTGVLKEALRASGRAGVVVSGGGPEEVLLLRWLDEAGISREAPSSTAVEGARLLLLGAGEGAPSPAPHGRGVAGNAGDPDVAAPILRADASAPEDDAFVPELDASTLQADASSLAGAALARARGLLHLGSSNKTCLLLSYALPIQPILPLGDLVASEIRSMTGSCTLPPCLRTASPEAVEAVDGALRAYLEEGFRLEDSLGGLTRPLRREVQVALDRARRAWHPLPMIPKLSRATLGLDLDL